MIPGSVLNKQSLWQKISSWNRTPTAAVRIISQRFILENLCAGSNKIFLPHQPTANRKSPTLIRYDGSQYLCSPSVGSVEFPRLFLPSKIRFPDGTLLPSLQLWDWFFVVGKGLGGLGGVGPSTIKLDLPL